jgi:small-conductance mechanosensitive channel
MLPLLRAAFGILVAVIAALIVLSRLGIDTGPLIAGAGVFGLAISFGSQSMVRDIISGLFYMWDDAFRVGEYIDTGRLKGTVEKLGIRSLKLRHHNGPLHTIPYGQLGAVTNLSRDFATIKFNLKLEPGTDIELVRRTAKQIGLAMQQDPDRRRGDAAAQTARHRGDHGKCGCRPLPGPPGKAELGAARIPEADVPGVRREGYRLCLRGTYLAYRPPS